MYVLFAVSCFKPLRRKCRFQLAYTILESLAEHKIVYNVSILDSLNPTELHLGLVMKILNFFDHLETHVFPFLPTPFV